MIDKQLRNFILDQLFALEIGQTRMYQGTNIDLARSIVRTLHYRETKWSSNLPKAHFRQIYVPSRNPSLINEGEPPRRLFILRIG